MLKLEYDLLCYVRTNERISCIDLLNTFPREDTTLTELQDIVNYLIDTHMLKSDPPTARCPNGSVKLETGGLLAIKLYQQENERKAKEDRKHATLTVIAAIASSVAASVITAILALLMS